MNDTDEEIDTSEIEEKAWILHMKRSTATAVEKMKSSPKSYAGLERTEE